MLHRSHTVVVLVATWFGPLIDATSLSAQESNHKVLAQNEVVNSVAFSPDSRILASGADNGKVRLWDVATRNLITEWESPNRITSLAFSPDGKALASASGKAVRLWDVATQKQIVAQEHESFVDEAVFSPDGKTLASAVGSTVRLWDVATRKQSAVLEVPDARPNRRRYVVSLAFSPDGKVLASGATHGLIQLWNSATRKQISTINHNGTVRTLAFSPDGSTLAAGGDDVFVRLWDVATQGEKTAFLFGAAVDSLAFSPNGKDVVIGGTSHRTDAESGPIQLWDVATSKRESHRLQGPDLPFAFRSIAISPDGRHVAASNVGIFLFSIKYK